LQLLKIEFNDDQQPLGSRRSGHVVAPGRSAGVTVVSATKNQFLCSIEAPFLRSDLGFVRAPRAAAVKTGRSIAPATAEGGALRS